MRIPSTLVVLLLGVAWLSLTSLDPSNPPTAKTGAPGEQTCAQSSCHTGGAFTGTVTLTGIPDTVVAGQAYTLTLTNASNAVKAGFQLTCLDGSNIKCGNLGTGMGVNITTASGHQYARQSAAKTMSNGIGAWNFTWTAPATLNGDSLRFYFVSLCANGNGNRTGDNVLINSKKVNFKAATSAAIDPEADRMVRIFPNPANDNLRIDLSNNASADVQLFDTNGRLVLRNTIDSGAQLNVAKLPDGYYTAEIRFDGRMAVKRIVVKH